MTLSVPLDKLYATIRNVYNVIKANSVTKMQLQSILGKLFHIVKCVLPARIFVGCLLDSLRAMRTDRTPVTDEMRAHLSWFLQFAHG